METAAATDLAVRRIQEGRGRDEIAGELVEAGSAEEAARALVDRLLAQRDEARGRERAVALFKAGKSKAEVWDTLVAEGVERNAATALVTEVGKLKDEADASARAAAPPPAPLGPSPYAPYGAYQGTDRTKVITGLVLFTLGFVVSVGTCSEASKSGGHYVMMWGPMAAGIVLILRGLGVQGR